MGAGDGQEDCCGMGGRLGIIAATTVAVGIRMVNLGMWYSTVDEQVNSAHSYFGA